MGDAVNAKRIADELALSRFGLRLVTKTDELEVLHCPIPGWADAKIRIVGFVGKEFWILSNDLTGRGAATGDIYGVAQVLHRWFDEAERARHFGGVAPYVN